MCLEVNTKYDKKNQNKTFEYYQNYFIRKRILAILVGW